MSPIHPDRGSQHIFTQRLLTETRQQASRCGRKALHACATRGWWAPKRVWHIAPSPMPPRGWPLDVDLASHGAQDVWASPWVLSAGPALRGCSPGTETASTRSERSWGRVSNQSLQQGCQVEKKKPNKKTEESSQPSAKPAIFSWISRNTSAFKTERGEKIKNPSSSTSIESIHEMRCKIPL